MESGSNVVNDNRKVVKDHKVIIDNRRKITLTGITKALSANATNVLLQQNQSKILVNGTNLHLSKLDVEQGAVEIEGEINGVKYLNNSSPEGFFKRIFK